MKSKCKEEIKTEKKVFSTKVIFTVRTPWKEDEVYIVGNLDKLGAWDPTKAIKCEYSSEKDEYIATKLLPVGEDVEFKVLNKKSWLGVEKGYFNEEIQNRSFNVCKGINMLIEVVKFN